MFLWLEVCYRLGFETDNGGNACLISKGATMSSQTALYQEMESEDGLPSSFYWVAWIRLAERSPSMLPISIIQWYSIDVLRTVDFIFGDTGQWRNGWDRKERKRYIWKLLQLLSSFDDSKNVFAFEYSQHGNAKTTKWSRNERVIQHTYTAFLKM